MHRALLGELLHPWRLWQPFSQVLLPPCYLCPPTFAQNKQDASLLFAEL